MHAVDTSDLKPSKVQSLLALQLDKLLGHLLTGHCALNMCSPHPMFVGLHSRSASINVRGMWRCCLSS